MRKSSAFGVARLVSLDGETMKRRLQLALTAFAITGVFGWFADVARAKEPVPTPPPGHGRGPYGHGSGILLVDVDPKTGNVTAVRMLASTGHAEFDAAAIKAFREKRFKPGTARQLRIPISFTVKGKKL